MAASDIKPGKVITTVRLRKRTAPNTAAGTMVVLAAGVSLDISAVVSGEEILKVSDWARIASGGFCWCGGLDQVPQPPASGVVAPAPPAVPGFADRAAKIATDEWEFFGRGTKHETDGSDQPGKEAYYERVGDYWLHGVSIEHRDGKNTGYAWSAAFISYVMREAGAGTRFRYNAQHSVYISRAISDLEAQNQAAGYWCYRLDDEKPAIGDIVCWSRQGGIDYDHQSNGNYKGHSDLVVAVRPQEIDIIGGNVSQSVTKRTFPLDANGFVKPATVGQETLFGLMKCRIA